jgi:hypothetical protein
MLEQFTHIGATSVWGMEDAKLRHFWRGLACGLMSFGALKQPLQRLGELIQLRHILAGDLSLFQFGDIGQNALQDVLGFRPGGLGVRII